MTKEQIEQDIASWEGRIREAHAQIKSLENQIALLNKGVDTFRKIVLRKKYELSKYR